MTSTSATIADQVRTLQEGMAGQLPPEVAAIFTAEQAGLDGAELPAGIAPVGSAMPDGALLEVHGSPTTLAQARGCKASVVVFYRGAWCPYCNLTLKAYQEQLAPALHERGIGLIALSPQTPDGSLSMAQANELSFTVLSDPGNQIAGQLGILTAPTEDAASAQAALGLDLRKVNADATSTLPMPTVVVVDASGIIRWLDVHPNYATRTEPATVLDALSVLG